MFGIVVPATFEHVERAGHVAVDVGLRILERVTHAGLRGEVNHARKFLAREQRLHAALVGEVHLHETKLRLPLEDGEARALEIRVVVVVEVVEPDDFVAARQQFLRDVGTNESGGAGEQDFHA